MSRRAETLRNTAARMRHSDAHWHAVADFLVEAAKWADRAESENSSSVRGALAVAVAYMHNVQQERAEEAEYHVEQLRDARDRAEQKLEAIEALADEWDTEGRGLIDHCESARDVHEGQALQRCAYDLREAAATDPEGVGTGAGERADELRRAADDWPEDGLTRAEAQRVLTDRADRIQAVADGGDPFGREERDEHLSGECSGLCGDHHWLDRPESDTRECLICGTEVAG